MPVQQLTRQEADSLVNMLRQGKVPEDKKEAVMASLNHHADQRDETDNFVRTRLDNRPHAQSIEETTERIQYFSPDLNAMTPEAREEWISSSHDHQALNAAQMGVDVRSGIPAEIRAKAGLLGFRPEIQATVIDELVRAQLGDQIPATMPVTGNVGGVPVALQPQEDGSFRYHAIDPTGFDMGNLAEFAGELPSIALETVGGIGGAAAGGAVGNAPGAVMGSAAGSAALAPLGLDARVWIAKQIGIPEELIDDAVRSEDRMYAAMLAAGGDLVTAGFLAGVRGAGNQFGGKILEPEDVSRVWDDTVDSMDKVAAFESRTGQELPVSIGEVTGDTDLIQAEKLLKQRARGKDAQQITKDAVVKERAVQESLRDMTEQRVRTPTDTQRGMGEVAEDVTTGIRGQADESRRLAEDAEADLDSFTRVMDESRSPETYTRVRGDVYEAAEQSRVAEQGAWDNYRSSVEWKQGQGSNIRFHSPAGSPIKNLLLQMDDDASRALLESTRKAQQAFIKDAGLPEEGVPTGIAGEFLDPRELHFALSDLKRRVRQADKAVDPDGFRVSDMRSLIGAIEETIESAPMSRMSSGRMVRPEKAAQVRESWDLANRQTIRTHSLYDNANMRALLERNPRTGELAMPQGMIYKRLFQENDSRFLDDALESVGHNPVTKADLAEELVKKHRNATRTDASGDAHRRFVDDHYDHLNSLGIRPDDLRGAAGLAQAAKRLKNEAAQVQKRLATTFGKRLSDDTADVVNVHDELLSVGHTKAANVMNYLDDSAPRLADEVRDHSLQQVRRELASGGDTTINFDGLWKTLDESSDTLRAMHGANYVHDLRILKDAQSVVERGRIGKSAIGQNAQPWFLDLTRSMWGPLSKKQRFLSAIQRTNRRMQAKGARQVFSSPEDLHQFVKQRNRSWDEVARDMTLSKGVRSLLGLEQNADVTGTDIAGKRDNVTPGSTLVPGRQGPAEAVGGRPAGDNQAYPKGVEQLHRHEGFRSEVYKDSVGVNTIGYGRNIEANPITPAEYRAMETTKEQVETNGITQEQASVLFEKDYEKAVATATRLPGWESLDNTRKDVLINMAFNMGPTRLRGFKKMLKAVKAGDFNRAADEMLDSRWANQVGSRAVELSEQMRNG